MAHIILLSWKKLFRDKVNTFWILCFPIVLGTLFNLAFSNLAKDEKMSPIPVAVILEDDEYADALEATIDEITDSADPMLDPTYCTRDEAMELLEAKEITGILQSGEQVSLTISSNMTNDTLNQSILQAFTNEYNMQLSKRRAEAVADYLTNKGITIKNVEGHGVAFGDATNRMVTITKK